MPASEQTWRNTKKLHAVFGATSLILLLSTVWLFVKDHRRSWKPYQSDFRDIDIRLTEMRKFQYTTDEVLAEHERLAELLSEVEGRGLSADLLAQFEAAAPAEADFSKIADDKAALAEKSSQAIEERKTLNRQSLRHDRFRLYADDLASLQKDLSEAAAPAQADVGKKIQDLAVKYAVALKNEVAAAESEATADGESLQQAAAAGAQEATVARAKLAAEQSAAWAAKLREVNEELARLVDGVNAAPTAAAPLDALIERFRQEAEGAEAARNAALVEAETLEAAAGKLRERVLSHLNKVLKDVRFVEDLELKNRKFRNADLDAAKANYGLGIRDGLPRDGAVMQARDAEVQRIKQDVAVITARYETASAQRRQLQELLQKMGAPVDDVAKRLADSQAAMKDLERTLAQRRANFFELRPNPFGKRWLELPILSAFNSPLKIDNLWADGLEQDINFRKVRRFDRCTTCHRAMEKTMPGSAVEPAYVSTYTLTVLLNPQPATAELLDGEAASEDPLSAALKAVESSFGVHITPYGLLDQNDVTIAYVRPRSVGAQAPVVDGDNVMQPVEAEQLRGMVLQPDALEWARAEPGLRVGDVVIGASAADAPPGSYDDVREARALVFRLVDAAKKGKPLRLTIRRGLPHPFVTHPRLDLFVGSLSPHKLADFACTICHEGQGSATDFKWASHTPNSVEQDRRWSADLGYFDNHHWIYPMYAKRFTESVCLKCHHGVSELMASEAYPDPPAPKVTRGHELILKFGCFGCHEINGYDSGTPIGPDLRLEPNYFAAALMLRGAAGFDQLPEATRGQVAELIERPELHAVRHSLLETLKQEAQAETPRLPRETLAKARTVLADVDSPGTLRKVGPSLRSVALKNDAAFLYDWILRPANFRPTTRMPQFFQQWGHLTKDDNDPESLRKAHDLEPVEAQSSAAYLMHYSQSFPSVTPPEGISESTAEQRVARGKILFEERGCLACHSHPDFPDVAKFRPSGALQQGPDLAALGAKFDPARNPNGRSWLYSWIKEPTRYHARTKMPNLMLDPIEVVDKEGKVVEVTDPAADIVEYLLSHSGDWKPEAPPQLASQGDQATPLRELMMLHLGGAFFQAEAEKVFKHGIPERRRGDLKGPEQELVVPDDQYDAGAELSDATRLLYLGRKTIGKYGCYACHDIPGFEDSKSIGAGLAEWGRKEAEKLAFEHIHEYLHGGHGHGGGHSAKPSGEHGEPEGAGDEAMHGGHAGEGPYPPFFEMQLNHGNRIGFLYQKLREPRSYDFQKARDKNFNEWLRMPKFPLNDQEREEIMTVVLGLVADPPNAKYVYQPNPRQKALNEGRAVLAKYNCSGCHVLQSEKWDLSFPPGEFGEQSGKSGFPFLTPDYTPDEIANSAQPGNDGRLRATIHGMPTLLDDAKARIVDSGGEPLFEGELYDPNRVTYSFDLWQPALLEGNVFQVGELPLPAAAPSIAARSPAHGGDLAKYLIRPVLQREKQLNPNQKGAEVWGWLPPPLTGEGAKVEAEWLHNFLLDPHQIRPAAVLRMPRFNMSSDEATQFVNYFAARDNAQYPYTYSPRRSAAQVEALDREYREQLGGGEPGQRLRDAMKIVTSGNYCVKCHWVADARPSAAGRAQAPNLANVFRRLRPDYLRRWIAKPSSVLPYTAMPVNIPYDNGEQLPDNKNWADLQKLYHGASVDQVDALVDLLLNYDRYATEQARIAPLVQQATPASTDPAATETPAAKAEATDAAATDAAATDAAEADAAEADAAEADAKAPAAAAEAAPASDAPAGDAAATKGGED